MRPEVFSEAFPCNRGCLQQEWRQDLASALFYCMSHASISTSQGRLQYSGTQYEPVCKGSEKLCIACSSWRWKPLVHSVFNPFDKPI